MAVAVREGAVLEVMEEAMVAEKVEVVRAEATVAVGVVVMGVATVVVGTVAAAAMASLGQVAAREAAVMTLAAPPTRWSQAMEKVTACPSGDPHFGRATLAVAPNVATLRAPSKRRTRRAAMPADVVPDSTPFSPSAC